MSTTETPQSRKARVAAIITDLWPHRMSTQAAEAIEHLYIGEMAAALAPLGAMGEVMNERIAQDVKWGEQNHPDGTGPRERFVIAFSLDSELMVEGDAFADAARRACDSAHRNGRGTWAQILLEEVAETFAESDPVKIRAELIQVAAVATAWIEAIDRREAQV